MKKYIKTVAVWLLIIATVFVGNIPQADYAETNTQKKIELQLESVDLFNDSGEKILSGSDTRPGAYVFLSYKWKINPTNLAAGDYFSFPVPSTLSLDGVSGRITNLSYEEYHGGAEQGNQSEIYGEYTVKDGQLTGSFNELGAERKLKGGWFVIGFMMKAGKHQISDNLTIEVESQTGNGGNSGNDGGNTSLSDEQIAFRKNGKLDDKPGPGNGDIAWDFNINWAGQKAQIEGGEITGLGDVFLIDEIADEDLVIEQPDRYNPMVSAPMYIPTTDGEMSGTTISDPEVPVCVVQYVSQDFNAFKNQIKIQASSEGKPAAGLYPGDETRKKTLIVYFGNLAGNGALLTYKKVLDRDMGEYIDQTVQSFNLAHSNSPITDEQKQKLKNIYKDDTPILAYNLSFRTKVRPKTYRYKKFYINEGALEFADSSGESSRTIGTAKVKYRGVYTAGGGYFDQPTFVKVKKTWRGAEGNDYPNEVEVKLLAQVGSDQPVEVERRALSAPLWYYIFDGLLKQTFDGKSITYSVEEEPVSGFQATSSPFHNSDGGYEIEIVNTKETTITTTTTTTTTTQSSQSDSQPTHSTVETSVEDASAEPKTTTASSTTTAAVSTTPTTTSTTASTSASSSNLSSSAANSSKTEASSTTGDSFTTSDDLTSVEITTEATATPVVPVSSAEIVVSPVVTTTAAPTPAPTTRTFEFIEIDEEIPLGVRTTAPLDLELFLIEESIPLGGVPTGGFPFGGGGQGYSGTSLPYTGFASMELFIGMGILIMAIGAVVMRRM